MSAGDRGGQGSGPGREGEASAADVVEALRAELAALRAAEGELAHLKDEIPRAEAERIFAETALRDAKRPPSIGARVSGSQALELVAALDSVRGSARPRGPGPSARPEVDNGASDAQLRAAAGALRDWLEAGAKVREQALARAPTEAIVRRVLVALVIGIVWASVKVHVALLLLILPIIVPYTLLARGGDDVRWRQAGAKRHFDRTGVAPPAEWEERAVRARQEEIESALASQTRAREGRAERQGGAVPAPEPSDIDPETARETLERLGHELRLPASAGGAQMPADAEEWLRRLAALHRAEIGLRRLQRRRGELAGATDRSREGLFRFLARRGEAPPEGRADPDALEAGLERVLVEGKIDPP